MNQRLTVELEYVKNDKVWRAYVPGDVRWDEVPAALFEMAAAVQALIKKAAEVNENNHKVEPVTDAPAAPIEPELVA